MKKTTAATAITLIIIASVSLQRGNMFGAGIAGVAGLMLLAYGAFMAQKQSKER